MNDKGNSENSSDNGFVALLALGLLGYAAYKAFTSSSQDSSIPSKKRLSSSMVDDIVNDSFRSLDEFDMGKLAMYYVMPDFLMGSVKNEIYHDMMFERINRIYKTLSSFKEEYEGFYPTLCESDISNVISFIKNDCYDEIKYTKFFASIKGSVIGKLPGLGLVSKATNAKMQYHILQSITKGLKEYFYCLFVYGGSADEAKAHLLRAYVYSFNDSVDFE